MTSIVGIVNSAGLGDLMEVNLRLCAVARHYPQHQVYAFVNPKTYDEACSLMLNPEIDFLVAGDRITDKFFGMMPWLGGGQAWATRMGDLTAPAIIMPTYGDWTLDPDQCLLYEELIDRTLFSLPAEVQAQCRRTLLELGLDESRWFVAMHIREDGYRSSTGHPRSIRDLGPYAGLIDHIVQAGGQVVRLGDPFMTPFPARPGLIDLSCVPGSFLAQAYAIARARFLYGSSSSPAIIAVGCNTPSAFANTFNAFNYISAPKNHIIATKQVPMPDGSLLRDAEAIERGNAHERHWYGKADQLVEMTAAELCELADMMIARTPDPGGWAVRPISPLPTLTAAGQVDPADIPRRKSWAPIYYSDVKRGRAPVST